ncbi:MAG: hypothetical protein H6816_12630 [Phycisphaerales bacterium]|nr:hypothetical protein [Phycisphaerales bacterium]
MTECMDSARSRPRLRSGAAPAGRLALLAAVLAWGGLAAPAPAADIVIPNASFEGPQTFFAYPEADAWDESGPVGEDPQLPGVVDTLDTGVFFNSPVLEGGAPSPYYITNGDGAQIGFIGADDASTIAFFQQLDVAYEVGGTYTLNLLVGESFFFPPLTYNPNDPNPPANPDPALLAVSLYYLGTNGAAVTVAERIVSADEMPGPPNQGVLLVDVGTTGAPVTAGDPWAGAPIGVMIRPLDGLAGVWNVDLARLSVSCSTGATGDADLDGDVDLTDYVALTQCLAGPGTTAPPDGCPPCAFARLDTDADGDVDLHDAASLARTLGD